MVQATCKTYERRIMDNMFKAAKGAVEKGLKATNKKFIKHISLTDHSLEDLAAMDHPYAPRHGKQGKSIHDPYWEIHKHTGGLLATGVQSPKTIVTDDSVVGNFGFAPDELPIWLVGGTSKMIPRPVISGTLVEMRGEIKKIITEAFKRRYGGNVGMEFGV